MDLDGKYIDVYIRTEDNPEQDFCFNVPAEKNLKVINKIFDVIPTSMSPGYFYNDKPKSYAKSVHPGYLTDAGCILFTDEAHLKQNIVHLDLNKPIGNQLAEGQLLVPIWEENKTRKFMTILVLLVWLYLDLPEFLSPTPGTAPTTVFFYLLEDYFPPKPERTIFDTKLAQILFFTFHIVKVLFFYLILWNGAWHPVSLNPFSKKSKLVKKSLNYEQLLSIGWTGVRRTPASDWSRLCLNNRTKLAGGLVAASKSGAFERPVGVYLHKGEGWAVLKNSKLDDVKVDAQLLNSEGKFVVSKNYFKELVRPLAAIKDEEELNLRVREFREYGYFAGPEILTAMFAKITPSHRLLKG